LAGRGQQHQGAAEQGGVKSDNCDSGALATLPRAVEQDLAVAGQQQVALPGVGGASQGAEEARGVEGPGKGAARGRGGGCSRGRVRRGEGSWAKNPRRSASRGVSQASDAGSRWTPAEGRRTVRPPPGALTGGRRCAKVQESIPAPGGGTPGAVVF